MRLDLLADVADVLETVPEDDFYLGTWKTPAWGECGTTACAVGWYIERRNPVNLVLGRLHMPTAINPKGIRLEDFNAIAFHFDIAKSEAEFLFGTEDYPESDETSRAEVIARIRAFVAEHSPAPVIEMKPTRPACVPAERTIRRAVWRVSTRQPVDRPDGRRRG
jgi:hypothetical protein